MRRESTDQIATRLLLAAAGKHDATLAGELKRASEALRRAAATPDIPRDSAEEALRLAELVADASNALSNVQDTCLDVLRKVGDSDKPVARALRDLAKDVARKARGKWAYL